jgi:DNA-binding transcriptional ArsR family regulator
MSKSTFSHHLRILREAGVVAKRMEGTKSFMCVRKADLDARFPGLIDSILNADAEMVPLR